MPFASWGSAVLRVGELCTLLPSRSWSNSHIQPPPPLYPRRCPPIHCQSNPPVTIAHSTKSSLAGILGNEFKKSITTYSDAVEELYSTWYQSGSFFGEAPVMGRSPEGWHVSRLSSHQGAQARPAHPPPPTLARHLRLTNQAALWCQGVRGKG